MTATKTMLVATMVWALAGSVQAQQPVTKANVMKVTATITAIDSTNRMVTLRDDQGNEDSFSVGPTVERFNELKVGQKVNFTYYESMVFYVV
jgi:hypothetical protein